CVHVAVLQETHIDLFTDERDQIWLQIMYGYIRRKIQLQDSAGVYFYKTQIISFFFLIIIANEASPYKTVEIYYGPMDINNKISRGQPSYKSKGTHKKALEKIRSPSPTAHAARETGKKTEKKRKKEAAGAIWL
ncbi:hypothetical protein ACJX0J_038029, partial [Zea mays]